MFAIWALWLSRYRWTPAIFVVLYLSVVGWWVSISPSHDRKWRPEVAVMPRATIDGDRVRITGVRNFDYRTRNDFTVRYEEREDWQDGATRAFGWFLGENDLQTALIDPGTGGCSDGLHPDRSNENMGAESVLSYLLGLLEIRQFSRAVATGRTRPSSKLVPNAIDTIPSRATSGSLFVPIPILESPDLISAPRSGQGRRQAIQTGD
jgi:hypothetical protein